MTITPTNANTSNQGQPTITITPMNAGIFDAPTLTSDQPPSNVPTLLITRPAT